MICTSEKKVISTLLNSIKKKNILLNHPIQRKPGQFSKLQKSLFIDSLLRDYPIPPLYMLKEDKKTYVIDGLQRITIIQAFVNDEFKLSSKLSPVNYEDGTTSFTTNIARKKFSQLEPELQSHLLGRELNVYTLSDCEENEINDIFLRLNNGVALNTSQKLKAAMSSDVQKKINEIKNLNFFENVASLTDSHKLKGYDDSCIVQTLMLHKGNTNFSKSSISSFVNDYVYDSTDFEAIETAVTELGNLLPDDLSGISRISAPLVIYGYMTCEDDSKDTYVSQIIEFFEDYDSQLDYKELCKHGTSSKHNVEERLQFFLDMQK